MLSKSECIYQTAESLTVPKLYKKVRKYDMRRMGQVKITIKKRAVAGERQELQLTFSEFVKLEESTSLTFASHRLIE